MPPELALMCISNLIGVPSRLEVTARKLKQENETIVLPRNVPGLETVILYPQTKCKSHLKCMYILRRVLLDSWEAPAGTRPTQNPENHETLRVTMSNSEACELVKYTWKGNVFYCGHFLHGLREFTLLFGRQKPKQHVRTSQWKGLLLIGRYIF